MKCRFWTPTCKLLRPAGAQLISPWLGTKITVVLEFICGENHVALCSRWTLLHLLCGQLSPDRGKSGKGLSAAMLQGSCVCFAHRVCVSGWKQQRQVSLLSPLASGSELFRVIWWRRWLVHLLASRKGWCGGEKGTGFILIWVGWKTMLRGDLFQITESAFCLLIWLNLLLFSVCFSSPFFPSSVSSHRYFGQKPKNLGENTLMMGWLPQNDLLGKTGFCACVCH